MDYYDWQDVKDDLDRIIKNKYNAADSERNHQTFAAALRLVMVNIK